MASRLLIVQYAGDFREAYQRMMNNESESYYSQRYSVETIISLKTIFNEVTYLCCQSETKYDEVLDCGIRSVGLGFARTDRYSALVNAVVAFAKQSAPTHMLLRTPILRVIRWGARRNINMVLSIADSFSDKGLRQQLRNFMLARVLNHPMVKWVGNHGMNACRSLEQLGVDPAKIVPWDWPYHNSPRDFAPKSFPEKSEWHAVYVGFVSEDKGVGDAIRAIGHLRSRDAPVRLSIYGKGNTEELGILVQQLGLAEYVKFMGLIPNDQVVRLMREADLVFVPSRRSYPEGLPLTIYEALCSRTPIVASDHPMFSHCLKHGWSSLVFMAGNSQDMAEKTHQLMHSGELYNSLSRASEEAWLGIQVRLKWREFLFAAFSSEAQSENLLRDNTLTKVAAKD